MVPYDMPHGGLRAWIESGVDPVRLYRHLGILARPAHAPVPVNPRPDHLALGGALDKLDTEIRLNVRVRDAQYRTLLTDCWKTVDDATDAMLQFEVANNFRFRGGERLTFHMRFNPNGWRTVMLAHISNRRIDSFPEWLKSLPDRDGVCRLDRLISEHFLIEQNELMRRASRYLALAPIRRAYESGCKLDELPVLQGPQGFGKGALIANMLPEHSRSDWFTSGTGFHLTERKRIEAAFGRVLRNIPEMEGMALRYQANKDYIAKSDDGSRHLPYARRSTKMPRCYACVGTTDKDQIFLPNDPAGNRRFVVVCLGRPTRAVAEYLDERREQLWAEAMYLNRTGVRGNPLTRCAAPPRRLPRTSTIATFSRNWCNAWTTRAMWKGRPCSKSAKPPAQAGP